MKGKVGGKNTTATKGLSTTPKGTNVLYAVLVVLAVATMPGMYTPESVPLPLLVLPSDSAHGQDQSNLLTVRAT